MKKDESSFRISRMPGTPGMILCLAAPAPSTSPIERPMRHINIGDEAKILAEREGFGPTLRIDNRQLVDLTYRLGRSHRLSHKVMTQKWHRRAWAMKSSPTANRGKVGAPFRSPVPCTVLSHGQQNRPLRPHCLRAHFQFSTGSR
jgi:hypothetical protein